MKYTFTTTEAEAREKFVLESRGDLPRHVLLKFLAYVLYRDAVEGVPLQIEQFVGQRHKPDLVAVEVGTGRVLLWIDCGQIETERLGRIARKNAGADVVVVKTTTREAIHYAQAAEKDLPPLGLSGNARSVTVLGFEEGFVEGLQDVLCGVNTVVVEREVGRLTLTWNGVVRASAVQYQTWN